MTVPRIPAHSADSGASGDAFTVDAGGARMRVHLCHQAMLLTISGYIDLANSDRVQGFASRVILAGNALILDLSGVDFLAARGISVLIAMDDACRIAQVPWALIPSRAVSRVLQLTACDATLPTAGSVSEALRQVTALSQARRRVALATTTSKHQAR